VCMDVSLLQLGKYFFRFLSVQYVDTRYSVQRQIECSQGVVTMLRTLEVQLRKIKWQRVRATITVRIQL